MSVIESHNLTAPYAKTIDISAEEMKREARLRDHFANFLGSARGELRAIYDTFISASPLAEDVLSHRHNSTRFAQTSREAQYARMRTSGL